MADPTPQELDNRITQAQSTADDAKNDINTHRYNLDIHTTLEWKNSVVLKETLGLYWTSAQVADKFADVQQQIDDIIAGGGGGGGDLSRYATKTYVSEQLQGYLQLAGGALTGNLIERNTDSEHLGICGAYWGHGAYLWLSGQNSDYAGSWYLSARDSDRSCDLVGSPSGVLSWGGKLVATEEYVDNSLTNYATKTELNNYFPKSGGALTGSVIARNVDNNNLEFYGGSEFRKGAILSLRGKGYQSREGFFELYADDGVNMSFLVGKPNGTLTWNDKNIDVIEEQGDGYIRYSNGLQICWGAISAQSQSGSTAVSFPKSFVSNNVYITVSVSNTNTMYVNVAEVGQSWVSFFNNNGNGTVTWHAIGKWK